MAGNSVANTTMVSVAGLLVLLRHRSNLRNIMGKKNDHTVEKATPTQKSSILGKSMVHLHSIGSLLTGLVHGL